MATDLEAPKPFVPSGFVDGNRLDAGGIEQMRFGLAGSGPLAKAVLDSNVVGARIQLGLGASAIAGIITMYGGTVLPAGYLWCDGLPYDKAVYPGLFTALGVDRYGVDTATQFYLPNLTSHLPRGAATTGGVVTTNNNNTPTIVNNNTNLDHTHITIGTGLHNHAVNGASTSSAGPHNHALNGANTGNASANHTHSATTAATGANNNVAAGNTSGRPNTGHMHNLGTSGDGAAHTHGVNAGGTNNDGNHNHNNNGANTATDTGGHGHNMSSAYDLGLSLTNLSHSHANTINSYVPAFVEVNYIIKT